jgi:MFS family permease
MRMFTGAKSESANGGKRSIAFLFVLFFGLVGFLTDITNEGTRSIIGPYLGLLGASAAAIAIVSGLSELVGYGLRVLFGWMADATGRYWAMMFVGYLINLVAVPALALAGEWPAAVCLIMVERIGRAILCPARDAMLSHAGKSVGSGWAYGVQEALSSVGGMLGPTIVVLVLIMGGGYHLGFEVLLVPALLAVVILAYVKRFDPSPHELKGPHRRTKRPERFSRTFLLFVMAGALMAAGYADFPLIAFHIEVFAGVTEGWVPIMYAVAMATDALSALIFGRLYDRVGLWPLIVASAVVPLFVPLIFSSDFEMVLCGMMLYGIGFGAQESVMRAIVADLTPSSRRGWAFGAYNAAFGLSWFLGSVAMGLLYDHSLEAMMALSIALQLGAIPVLVLVQRGWPKAQSSPQGGAVPNA